MIGILLKHSTDRQEAEHILRRFQLRDFLVSTRCSVVFVAQRQVRASDIVDEVLLAARALQIHGVRTKIIYPI